MVNIHLSWKIFLTVCEVWFPVPGAVLELPSSWRPRWLWLYVLERPVDGVIGRWVRRKTLVTDLSTIDDLFGQMSHTMRYEIRRAMSRDGVRLVDDWTPAQLVGFAERCDAGNKNRPLLGRLEALEAQNRLTIRAALLGDEPLCAHATIHDGRIGRGLHSFSARHLGDKSHAAQVARATKLLYYRDLFYLRDLGLREFDWGGFTGRPGNGIDSLKLEFRGALRHMWDFDGVSLPRLAPHYDSDLPSSMARPSRPTTNADR